MYILIDIGGTKTRIAASRDLKSFESPAIFETPQSFKEGVSVIVKYAREASGNEKIEAAAVGIAASPNRGKTELSGGGPNIADWLGKPLKEKLEKGLDAPVYLENDTAMGGLAQIVYGPAKGSEIAVYVTISTGVGGCRFVGGEIDKSAMGFEPGWQIIGCPDICTEHTDGSEGHPWISGYCSKGYLMSHIGGACVEMEEGKKPYEILDDKFWDKKAKILARGLHNICTMWSPDIIVLGGSMMKEVGIPIDKTEIYLKQTLKDVFQTTPKLARAEFGDEMGLYGAMAYLKQKIK